jgi:hypothetical protein
MGHLGGAPAAVGDAPALVAAAVRAAAEAGVPRRSLAAVAAAAVSAALAAAGERQDDGPGCAEGPPPGLSRSARRRKARKAAKASGAVRVADPGGLPSEKACIVADGPPTSAVDPRFGRADGGYSEVVPYLRQQLQELTEGLEQRTEHAEQQARDECERLNESMAKLRSALQEGKRTKPPAIEIRPCSSS